MQIQGKFSVSVSPLKNYGKSADASSLGRMSIDKVFSGQLSGKSLGEMLNVMTPTKGSAGYVAIEQFTGTLENRQGSFVLQHYGIMKNGENHLILEVVPDSGTGQLAGISGTMDIQLEDKQHFYHFDYTLPSQD